MGIRVFWIEPNDQERIWLRRYSLSDQRKCSKTGHYCNGMFLIGDAAIRYGQTRDGFRTVEDRLPHETPPHSDPRWPMKCDDCGTPFESTDPYQVHTRSLYVRPETGEVMTTEEAPPGACWNNWWIADRRTDVPTGVGYMLGPDRRSLSVRCPDGREWMIDSRAKNCTMPNDNTHHCWCRHGKPEDGTLHVDKQGYPTCAAGAGSIDTGTYHGFLHHGSFT